MNVHSKELRTHQEGLPPHHYFIDFFQLKLNNTSNHDLKRIPGREQGM